MPQHLIGEERIAGRAHRDGGGERPTVVVELVAGHRGQQVLDTLAVEAAQREALDAVGAVDVGQQPTDRMGAVDLGVAVGAEHTQAAFGIGAEQMAQQGDGRRRGPVQIVEHEHHRSDLGGAPQQIRHRVEEPGLLERRRGPDGFVRLDGRDEAPDLATVLRHMGRHHVGVETGQPRPQGLGEGLVRDREVFRTATVEHQRALVVGATGHRRDQAGLAHPRFTGDEHGATLTRARRLERRAQHVELLAPTDHQLPRRLRQRRRQGPPAGPHRRGCCTRPRGRRCP